MSTSTFAKRSLHDSNQRALVFFRAVGLLSLAYFLTTEVWSQRQLKVAQDGTKPFKAIQDAINAAVDGDQIIVSPGRYVERLDSGGKNIVITTNSTANPGGCVLTSPAGIPSALTLRKSAQMRGFHITGVKPRGPAVVLEGAVMDGCIIDDCTGGWEGAAVSGYGTLQNCKVDNCNGFMWGGLGGALNSTAQGKLLVINCSFSRADRILAPNRAYADCEFENCLFFDNSPGDAGWGGPQALFDISDGPGIRFFACTFVIDPTFRIIASGIPSTEFTDCILFAKPSADDPRGLLLAKSPTTTITIRNSIYFGRKLIDDLEGVASGVDVASSVVQKDPLFRSVTGKDFTLKFSSPAIDAGVVLSLQTTTDLAGRARVAGVAPDLGAYERPVPSAIEVSADGTKDFIAVQDALDAAPAGSEIDVQPGSYSENLRIQKKNLTVKSLAGPAFTILDGKFRGKTVYIADSDGLHFEGFTIRGGRKQAGQDRGDGMEIALSQVQIVNCTFTGNQATHLKVAGDSVIQRCIFAKTVDSSDLPLFADNATSGGFYENCLINCGRDYVIGGNAWPSFSFCTVVGFNERFYLCGGTGEASVRNCIVFSPTGDFADISCGGGGLRLNVADCLLSGSFADLTNCTSGRSIRFQNCASVRDPGFTDDRNGNFTLGPFSLAIGRADDNSVNSDLLGNRRPVPSESLADLGAYESPWAFPLAQMTSPSRITAQVGVPVSQQIVASAMPLGFGCADLPAGLKIEAASGLITGTPLTSGAFQSHMTITNRGGITTNALAISIAKGVPVVVWNPPSTIPYGTLLDGAIYNCTCQVLGQFAFDPPLGTKLEPGTSRLRVTFTPTDPSNYSNVTLTNVITITKLSQQLELSLPSEAVLGDAPITFAASSSSGLPVNVYVVGGPAKMNGNFLQIVGGGFIVIRAVQDGDSHYDPAEPIERMIEVKLRPQITSTAGGTVIKEPTTDTMSFGTVSVLTAVPDNGFIFEGWTGDSSSRENPLSVVITNNTRIQAVFNPRWMLTLTNTVGGSVISEPSPSTVTNGSVVVVTALPDSGYGFRGWQGTMISTDNPLDFVLNTNISLIANFDRIVKLMVNQSEGGSLTVTPAKAQYLDGDKVTAVARAQEGYRFQDWAGSLAGQPETVMLVLSNDLVLNAVFTKLQKVLLTQTGEGSVQVVDGLYHALGEKVTVTAQPAQGWIFANWQGAATGTDNPVTFTLSTNATLNAVFKRLFSITLLPAKGGTLVVSPTNSPLPDGTLITVSASPDKYYRFHGWTGSVSGANSPITIALATNLIIGAVFSPSHRLIPAATQDLIQGFKMQVEGEIRMAYVIEASSGLMSWSSLATITNNAGTVEFLDRQASGLNRRFYRVRPAE
jgi:Divergent InlB B-repeat domain/Pectinesterase